MTGLTWWRARSSHTLVDTLAAHLGTFRDDPFALDLVCVPHPGMARWLGQQLARRIGEPGEGICAGVDFITVDGLAAKLRRQLVAEPDPWQPERLRWVLLRLILDADQPALTHVQAHARAGREAVGLAGRLAEMFARYAQWRRPLLSNWLAGNDIGLDDAPLGDNAWQPVLWRLAVAEIGKDPLHDAHLVRAALRDTPDLFTLPSVISLFTPGPLSPPQHDLIQAIAAHRDVRVLERVGAASGHPLVDRLGQRQLRAAAPPVEVAWLPEPPARRDHLLGWLSADLAAGESRPGGRVLAADDRSIQVHASHDLDRQVEVLRDALAERFASDPTLEPRDVVIACADLAAATPLLTASFSLPEGVAARHPACTFRVHLADQSAADVNPLVSVLLRLLALSHSRATLTDVLDLLFTPAVSARFGITADDHERLTTMVTRAGVRWGLNQQHRAPFGLAGYPQNTWGAGLERLLLGVALSEDGLPHIRHVLPLDDVGSGDLTLIGAVVEFITRISTLGRQFAEPATPAEWSRRLRQAVELISDVSGDDAWQVGHLAAGLGRIGERGGDLVRLGVADVERAIADEFAATGTRPPFGNGSLIVCSLASIQHVPYRVVCLLGLDDRVFPRPPRRDGDDLMLTHRELSDPDPTATDCQHLLDTLTCASDAVIITYSGRSSATNQELPPPAALIDVLEALDQTAVTADGTPVSAAVTTEHRLQPFDPAYFDGRLTSYDPLAFTGALALTAPARPPVRPVTLPPTPPLEHLSLDDLISCFRDPVRFYERTRLGLSDWNHDGDPDAMPVELNGLESWQIGDRALRLVAAGHDPARVYAAEQRRGSAPPGRLGDLTLDTIFGRVQRTLHDAPQGAVSLHDLTVRVGGVTVSGRVRLTGDRVIDVAYSTLKPDRRMSAWLTLLVARAVGLDVTEALVLTPKGRTRLSAPSVEASQELLARAVRCVELEGPLPAPASIGYRIAQAWSIHDDPFAGRDLPGHWHDLGPAWKRHFSDLAALRAVPNVGLSQLSDLASLLEAICRLVWLPLVEAEEQ